MRAQHRTGCIGSFALGVVGLLIAVPLIRSGLDDRYYIGPRSAHFDGERFFNPGPQPRTGFGAFLRWQLLRAKAEWPGPIPVAQVRPAARVVGDAMMVTVVGHATVLVLTAGLNILTDPIWSERASPFDWIGPKRVRAPGVAFDALPKIDIVLISHNHYDHLDLATLERLWRRDRPLIVTPLGNGALMARRGIAALARDWGQQIAVTSDVSITVERVQHWSSRWGADRNRALWGGFTLPTPAGSIFFAGDWGYGDGAAFRATAARGRYRLALLPIGAYEPRWLMRYQHMNPVEAVAAFRELGAQTAIGIHWGVWQLTDEAIEAPRVALARALRQARIASKCFIAPEPGQTVAVPR